MDSISPDGGFVATDSNKGWKWAVLRGRLLDKGKGEM
jgi:hypothetical protein